MAVKENIRRNLYEQGLLDKEIAERTGVTRAAIWRWRRDRNLPSHHVEKNTEREKLRTELLQRGYSDRQIAKETNVGVNAIRRWRRKNAAADFSKYDVSGRPEEERAILRSFFIDLLYAVDSTEARKPDVGTFMTVWREIRNERDS